ncbi:MAG: hypothetical protein EOP48_08925 [Sphingobacteriales bacterium]|nr:MAG: hypothetical protein EOP48_08925 [Sphingobacteriales bacterium]
MKTLDALKKRLQTGKVYRRADLRKWTPSVDTHLRNMVEVGILEKLSRGLYYAPKHGVFGKTPPEERELIKAFLKDDRFVIISQGHYNMLGVGTTQLYNERRVYNHKRNGIIKIGNSSFHFVRKRYVPLKVTQEFLLVDLFNNLKDLEEDQIVLLNNVRKKANGMDRSRLKKLVLEFGTGATKKTLSAVFE